MTRRSFLVRTAAAAVTLGSGIAPAATGTPLPPLPYAPGALEPFVSARTMEIHYGKHHRGYVDKVNELVAGTDLHGRPIDAIVKAAVGAPARTALFNAAAQAWNHEFFWQSMRPAGGAPPPAALATRITEAFGGMSGLRTAIAGAAAAQFGSGWVWLVRDASGALAVTSTANADTPLTTTQIPLLTIDVWEHAYYLDYQNRRADFVTALFDNLLNWEFAAANDARRP